MRMLYIDIDTLRPDHLGCYGYHRNTTPNIDRIARDAVRFENNYVSDAPCLPSRTALWSGRHGFRNGVVGHMGSSADPFNDGCPRGFRDSFDATSWMNALRRAG
ncbi:MAG: sulfatase-like hydrolase/transferase, partial [Anaerolineae bacterium]|nr:sulfatase-like hydrolase/transferase [Anaerolineae bacterium]